MADFDKEKSLIIYNPSSGGRKTNELARSFSKRINIKNVSLLEADLLKVDPNGALIVFGGDGSLGSIATKLKNRPKKPLIVVAGGGSENTLKKMLQGKNRSTSETDLQNGRVNESSILPFRPGEIDNGMLFIVGVGLGSIETIWSQRLAYWRKKMPSKFSRIVTAIDTGARLFPHKLTFESVLVGTEFGPLTIPVHRAITEDELVLTGLIKSGFTSFIHASYAVALWKLGRGMPNNIFTTSPFKEPMTIVRDKEIGVINVDGENISWPFKKIMFRRSDRVFNLTALKGN